MSDEQPKNVTSVPPPTDEIDQDWGGTPAPPGTDTKSSPTASEAKPVKAASKPSPSTSKAKSKEDEDEDEEDDEDEDEDGEDEETEDESDEDADEEDDEDEDVDEDEEDDEKSTASPASSPSRSATQRAAATASDDWLPDWAPWAVLGGLVAVGMYGGLGFISAPKLERAPGAEAAHEESAAKPKIAAAAATAQPGAGDEESVEASHLLVAYQGSMRASETITRTKDEARARAAEALAKAKKGAAFDKLVGEYSDEPNAAARGGKLGTFTRTRMVKPFADAAFALKPGQLSGVVETPFGFHVILRTK